MIKDRQQAAISCKECKISHLCLLKQFSDQEKDRVNRLIQKVKILDKGEHVYRENDRVEYVYAVHSGTLKDYYVDENGQEYINNFYFPGDIVALEAITQKKHTFSAIALNKTTLCMIPTAILLIEMQSFPALLQRILQISSSKMLNDKHIRPTTNAKQRVADFLVNMLSRLEERHGKTDSFQLPMTQIDMSYMIGIAYETVSRILHHFEEEKIIQINNHRITIINSQELLSLSNNRQLHIPSSTV